MTKSGEGEITRRSSARPHRGSIFATIGPAIAGVVVAVTALGINVSWGTPGSAKTSAAVTLHGNADIGIGFSAPTITWSADAKANARAVAGAEGCSDRSFVDAVGALPSPCRYGVPAPGQSLMATLSRHTLALQRVLDALAR